MKICKNCGYRAPDDTNFCMTCGIPLEIEEPAPVQPPVATTTSSVGKDFDFNTNTAAPVTQERYEYKVLTQKDKWFSGKFDPANLEHALNAYAQQGWRVIGCATADIAGFGAARQEFVSILERKL